MTYCLGILLPAGLVLTSDSRSNAGVDQIAQVRKMTLVTAGERVIVILSSGNLATTQAVVTTLREAAGTGDLGYDLHTAPTMFEAAKMVGAKLREIVDRDGRYVEPYGDVGASFLVGGQIGGEAPRLFQVYSAGNFIEASDRSPFLQIGETKYGKPILDRALTADMTLDQAAKLTLLSFDATMRSNLSVGLPIDMLRYEANSFSTANFVSFDRGNDYWNELRREYSDGLFAVVSRLPPPPPA
ncbi:MAG: Peptidase, family [Caulobacteraceae bacterium]|nr:Peptidase, family [Caulobacteraceae bacterium]